MKCKVCNNEINSNCEACPFCGTTNDRYVPKTGSIILIILGIFFPLVAIVIALTSYRNKPHYAKKIYTGFFIGITLKLIIPIIFIVLSLILAVNSNQCKIYGEDYYLHRENDKYYCKTDEFDEIYELPDKDFKIVIDEFFSNLNK